MIVVGDRALIVAGSHKGNSGVVRFIGLTRFATGRWVGIELDAAQGDHDGAFRGVKYFECKQGHGVFVKLGLVRIQNDDGDGGGGDGDDAGGRRGSITSPLSNSNRTKRALLDSQAAVASSSSSSTVSSSSSSSSSSPSKQRKKKKKKKRGSVSRKASLSASPLAKQMRRMHHRNRSSGNMIVSGAAGLAKLFPELPAPQPRSVKELGLAKFDRVAFLEVDDSKQSQFDELVRRFQMFGGRVSDGITFSIAGDKVESEDINADQIRLPHQCKVYCVCEQGDSLSQIAAVVVKQQCQSVDVQLPHGTEGGLDPFVLPKQSLAELQASLDEQKKAAEDDEAKESQGGTKKTKKVKRVVDKDIVDVHRETCYEYHAVDERTKRLFDSYFGTPMRARFGEEDPESGAGAGDTRQSMVNIEQIAAKRATSLDASRHYFDMCYYDAMLDEPILLDPDNPTSSVRNVHIISFNRATHVLLLRILERMETRFELKSEDGNKANVQPLAGIEIHPIDCPDVLYCNSKKLALSFRDNLRRIVAH
eukprot:TRINITY_DN67669_c6_g1_i2.p1 TRINITY_DN67669_c6_g1~~TRINITY_DN67669_c6_g1_i2.p1  ORF type:complete len:534 (+),score=296.80 TRINITY_DN67669_c6_g1_i2:63-1664(+)